MNSNQPQRFHSITMAPGPRPTVDISLPPGILSPVRHAFLAAGVWGGVVLVILLIVVLVGFLNGTIERIDPLLVLIMFLAASAVSLWRFYSEYKERDRWFRESGAMPDLTLPDISQAQWDGMVAQAGRPATPITSAQARRPNGTIGRVVFPEKLGMTEDKLVRLAAGVASQTVSWSRRGLAEIIEPERYTAFCQVLLDRHFLRPEGKGVTLTSDGHEWFLSIAREAGLLPRPVDDEGDE